MSKLIPPGYFRLFYSHRTLAETSLLFLFAFFFSLACGQRGFFPLDQSIVFDGAYRIVSGQVPFRDFVTPHGLLVYYFQAAFFAIFGVSHFSYIISAAFLNVIAAAFVIRILGLLFPARRRSALIAASITSIWFFPPFGTPFAEHCAFLLGLIGIDFLLTGLLSPSEQSPYGKALLIFISGVALGLSFFCKQNVCLFLLPLFLVTPLVVWWPDFRSVGKSLQWLLLGLIIGLAVFPGLIFARGNLSPFIEYYLRLPFATGLRRFSGGFGSVSESDNLSLILGVLVIVLLASLALRKQVARIFYALLEKRSRFLNETIAAWLAIYILLLSHFMRKSMLNSMTIADLYIGLLLGLVSALVIERAGSNVSGLLKISFNFIVASVLVFGLYLSWNRLVHESLELAQFHSTLSIPRLEWLRWGDPTIIREGELPKTEPGTDVSERDLTALVDYLSGRDQNFFIFPDFTFLYGVLQRPSVQPLLFFHKGLTYPSQYNSEIDSWIVDGLIQNQVSIAVVEQRSFFGTQARLDDFPILKRFLSTNFKEERVIGLFKILRLRTIEEDLPVSEE